MSNSKCISQKQLNNKGLAWKWALNTQCRFKHTVNLFNWCEYDTLIDADNLLMLTGGRWSGIKSRFLDAYRSTDHHLHRPATHRAHFRSTGAFWKTSGGLHSHGRLGGHLEFSRVLRSVCRQRLLHQSGERCHFYIQPCVYNCRVAGFTAGCCLLNRAQIVGRNKMGVRKPIIV